jgi:hypothetical protein
MRIHVSAVFLYAERQLEMMNNSGLTIPFNQVLSNELSWHDETTGFLLVLSIFMKTYNCEHKEKLHPQYVCCRRRNCHQT